MLKNLLQICIHHEGPLPQLQYSMVIHFRYLVLLNSISYLSKSLSPSFYITRSLSLLSKERIVSAWIVFAKGRHTAKVDFCCVPEVRHTAKGAFRRVSLWAHGKRWRQSGPLDGAATSSCARHAAHGEKKALPCATCRHTAKKDLHHTPWWHRMAWARVCHVLSLCRVSRHGTWRRVGFAECFLIAVCFLWGTRQPVSLLCVRKKHTAKILAHGIFTFLGSAFPNDT